MRRFVPTLFIFTNIILFLGPRTSDAQTETDSQHVQTAAEISVTGEAVPGMLGQETPVGPYGQPEWTTGRMFGTSRVYVIPPGRIEFVQFWTPEFKDGENEHTFREEIEIGLPGR